MNKLNKLYNYLIKNSYFIEASYLQKLAARIDEEKYKNDYPQIYYIWSSTFHTHNIPWNGFANIIKQLEENNIELDKNRPYSYEELIGFLSDIKQQRKRKSKDEILKYLNQNLTSDQIPSEEDLNLAKQNGLNKEEILYLIIDKQNHTWFEKVDVASKFNNARETAFPEEAKNKTILDFNNIDEVLDFIYLNVNKAPVDLKDFYEGIEQEALATSETVYNSNNYLVKHSKSMKAAQYWEQSCVTVDKEGKVTEGTCTSRIGDDNYFDYYDNEADEPIHSFQIITKEYQTLKETPRTSFKDKNKLFNFISLSISKDTGKVKWGGHDTVNRVNQEVEACDLVYCLKDEYEAVVNALIKYCASELNLTVGEDEFLDEMFCETDIQQGYYSATKFFSFNLDEKYPEHIDHYIGLLSPSEYFKLNFDKKYPENIYEKLMDLDSKTFFDMKLQDKYESDFPNIIDEKLKHMESYDFFKRKLDDTYKEMVPIHLEKIHSDLSIKDIENLRFVEKTKLLRLATTYIKLNLGEKYKHSKTIDTVLSVLAEHDSQFYFKEKLDKKYQNTEAQRNIAYNAIKKLTPENFFEGDEKSIAERYKNISSEISEESEDTQEEIQHKMRLDKLWDYKLNTLKDTLSQKSSGEFFRFHYDRLYGYHVPNVVRKKLEDFKEEEEISTFNFQRTGRYENKYFKYKLDEKYGEKYPEILKKHLSELSMKNYFFYDLDEKYGEDDEKHGEDFKNILKDKLNNMYLSSCVERNLDFKYNDLVYELRKDDIKELSPEAYFELELNFSFGDKDEELLKENLKKLPAKLMCENFLAGRRNSSRLDFIRKFLEDNSISYTLFDFYADKFTEIVKPKIMEITTKQFFREIENLKLDKHFKENKEEIIKHFVNKATGDEYNYFKLEEKYPQYISKDIQIEKMKTIDPEEFFRDHDRPFSKAKKYYEKFPDLIETKLKELTPFQYFTTEWKSKTSVAERFGMQYPEILKDNLNKFKAHLYFVGENVDDLFAKEFPDIFLEKVKEMHPYHFFKNNLHNKYAEGELAIPLNILIEKANQLEPEYLSELGLDKDERFNSITKY